MLVVGCLTYLTTLSSRPPENLSVLRRVSSTVNWLSGSRDTGCHAHHDGSHSNHDDARTACNHAGHNHSDPDDDTVAHRRPAGRPGVAAATTTDAQGNTSV